ncbi:N-formylglutamate amidohydrolase [Novispirillum itersonii]|uniref:N-formylglutamate amidohydrolase n=1 Tax=Novispirillum itersonii TaxID=189 RepID=UPI000380724A|nr:N-formylglutamate amidohydrolase [Novispirillum itersonii]
METGSPQLHPAEERPPFVLDRPAQQTLPLVVTSPHSGDYYPQAFLDSSQLDPSAIRRSEDCYVHELVADAPDLGAPLLRATYPRAYLDLNREAWELDPEMFDTPLPPGINSTSPRVASGLGTIARIVGNGNTIYRGKLSFSDAEARIRCLYHPYHEALQRLIEETRARFGYCLLLDCHSMPSVTVPAGPPVTGFVLGDCYGVSCHRSLADAARSALERGGWRVMRNTPYAGGFITRHYGQPENGVHSLQIEINRSLYMDESTYDRRRGFSTLRALMRDTLMAVTHRAGIVLKR